eukprot:g8180.t1
MEPHPRRVVRRTPELANAKETSRPSPAESRPNRGRPGSRHIAPLPLYSRAGKPVTVPTSHRSYIVQTPPVPAKTVMHRSSSAAGQLVTEPITGRLQAPPGMPRLASCEASAPTSAASSSRLPSKEVEPDERPAVLERLKVLLADPGIVAKTLKSCYEAVGGLPQGQVPCDAAVKALVTAHSMLLKGLSSTSISEAKWRSLLKKAGIYSPEEPSGKSGRDRYECFEFRAKAALGKVFRCRHIESQSLAEVRQIRKDKVCVPMDYIRTSLHRISELNHPNDFRNFFVVSEPIDSLEVMDFMQSSFVRGSTVSEAHVASLLRQVLDACAYCHAQQLGPVMHRDLQPEAVLVEEISREDGARGLKAWVSCFGLQPLFDLHGLGGSLPASCLPPVNSAAPQLAPEALPCSTGPEFLAPEVWSRDYGPKCDVWSCGCLLFLLLTGRPPFPPRKSAQRCALKRLSTAALPRSLRSEARRRLRELLLEAPGKNSREVLHLEAFELLASAELDGHEASPPWFSSEEIQSSLAAPLMQVLLSHWERDEFSLGKLMMLQLRWLEAGDVAPMAAAGFALKVLRRVGERERTSSAPLRWSEDVDLAFRSRDRVGSSLRRLSRLTLPRDQMVPFLVKSLHHFLAAAETNTECQQLCLEILAFLCGKDEDLDCASDIRERYPIDEIWNLMMDADEEFHQDRLKLFADSKGANGATPVGAWNYWVIPLLKVQQVTSQEKCKTCMNSVYMANFMALVVLIDAVCTVADIDATAQQQQSGDLVQVISDLCLTAYSLEVLGLLYLYGFHLLKDWMMLLDVVIVVCGWGEKILAAAIASSLGFRISVLRALRLVRIFRLMRLLKRIRPLRDAWQEIEMWMRSREIAVPVIQKHPGTAIIFVGSLLTLVFGVLNLIVAVVVDTFADARLNDVQNLAEEMEDEIEHDRKALAKLFARIDKDGSGQLTLQEMIEGARQDPGFQSRLRVMDIDEHDLEQLFQMIDRDQSGTIEVAEFIGPLSRWAHDSKTAPRFIKYHMLQTMQMQEDLWELSVECFNQLNTKIEALAGRMAGEYPAAEGPPKSREMSFEGAAPSEEVMTHIGSLDSRASQGSHITETMMSMDVSGNVKVQLDGFDSVLSPSASPVVTKETAPREMLDQPKASPDPDLWAPKSTEQQFREKSSVLEGLLESAMSKLEGKLDLLLESRGRRHELLASPEGHNALSEAIGKPKSKKKGKILHPEAFRNMYMDRGKRLSLIPPPPSSPPSSGDPSPGCPGVVLCIRLWDGQDKPKDTVLINGIGFVAACVNSEILRMHAMKDLDLLRALEVDAITTQEPDWQLFRTVSTAALALCKRMLDKECMPHAALMQSHAQSKFFQVLMNVVASEIKVGGLRLIRAALQRYDRHGSGYIAAPDLEAVFHELSVSAATSEQALRALDVAGTGQISYTLFMAGCVDLVDDKLDHMLWKVFSMVDEDCTGEMETLDFVGKQLGEALKALRPRGYEETDREAFLVSQVSLARQRRQLLESPDTPRAAPSFLCPAPGAGVPEGGVYETEIEKWHFQRHQMWAEDQDLCHRSFGLWTRGGSLSCPLRYAVIGNFVGLAPGDLVLDIGSGCGHMGAWFHEARKWTASATAKPCFVPFPEIRTLTSICAMDFTDRRGHGEDCLELCILVHGMGLLALRGSERVR